MQANYIIAHVQVVARTLTLGVAIVMLSLVRVLKVRESQLHINKGHLQCNTMSVCACTG